ncbi:MAG: GNAT family N-acetyltransferase [Anaerolineae bacterium]|nr:GNAT family N-acetyltransferase [Anaerolineae bacterium]
MSDIAADTTPNVIPAPVIRRMTPDDLPVVCEIDRATFETYRRQHRQLARPLRLRTPENMDAAFNRPYPGVVIESPPGRIAGYCFTHVWGDLGWLGTLGVTPPKQGFGLGRRVIAAGLDLLRGAGCTTFALETMPESGKNLALYTTLDLEPRQMTLLCQGNPPTIREQSYGWWMGGDELRTITEQLVPGLDPTPAATWLAQEESGDTLVWYDGPDPVAFAALRYAPRRLESASLHIVIEVAACLPRAIQHWPRFLGEMQYYARMKGQSGLVMPINARQIDLLRATLDAGYQIVHTRVRMVNGIALGAPDAYLMMTLAI